MQEYLLYSSVAALLIGIALTIWKQARGHLNPKEARSRLITATVIGVLLWRMMHDVLLRAR